MSIPRSLYKKLLIKVPAKGIDANWSQRVKDVSPVITNFEKWSDKRKKLYFKDEQEMVVENHLENFRLEENVYGRLLASPMRAEKISKLKSCRELLIPLKVVPTVSSEDPGENSKLKLVPILNYSKPFKSSYVLNSASIVCENLAAAVSWFPLSILQRSTPKRLSVDTSTFLSEYKTQLLQLIKTRVSKIPNAKPSLGNCVLLTFDKTRTMPVEIQQIKVSDGSRVRRSVFNLGCLQEPTLETTINKYTLNKGISLDSNDDKDLIKHLYRFVLFSLK